MDLAKIPPIQQKRIVTFVNYFIIDTISFLDNFINATENTLWKLEKKMQKLDTTLKLLEAKLNFIPESTKTDSSSIAPPVKPAEKNDSPINVLEDNTERIEDGHDEENEKTSLVEEIPEEIQKFIKMVKVGVPIEAVKLKMKNENIDPDLLKLS